MLTAIDTHQFVKSFIMAVKSKEKSAEKQAELIVKTINEAQVINFENLATKQDLKAEIRNVRSELQEVKTELQTEIREFKAELQTEIREVKTELRSEVKSLRHEIKIAMLTTIISLGVIMTFIEKFVGN